MIHIKKSLKKYTALNSSIFFPPCLIWGLKIVLTSVIQFLHVFM